MTNMTTFLSSLDRPTPPADLGHELRALWWAGRSEWSKAHAQVDSSSGRRAAWVHAYLHRWEGDIDNAHYWYRQAGRQLPDQSLDNEWHEITRSLLRELSPQL
ncbi:hypothetical protein [Salinicola halimionae]|uniref:hypothetical protein n=1 Tax=Salinicola halimionae TaxID=1949081 RepID=UPI001CB6E24A|nr:hypothetical protein [Salinicola halimionae]